MKKWESKHLTLLSNNKWRLGSPDEEVPELWNGDKGYLLDVWSEDDMKVKVPLDDLIPKLESIYEIDIKKVEVKANVLEILAVPHRAVEMITCELRLNSDEELFGGL